MKKKYFIYNGYKFEEDFTGFNDLDPEERAAQELNDQDMYIEPGEPHQPYPLPFTRTNVVTDSREPDELCDDDDDHEPLYSSYVESIEHKERFQEDIPNLMQDIAAAATTRTIQSSGNIGREDDHKTEDDIHMFIKPSGEEYSSRKNEKPEVDDKISNKLDKNLIKVRTAFDRMLSDCGVKQSTSRKKMFDLMFSILAPFIVDLINNKGKWQQRYPNLLGKIQNLIHTFKTGNRIMRH